MLRATKEMGHVEPQGLGTRDFLVKVPGKAILLGEHAVVFGGRQRALAVSLGLWTVAGAFGNGGEGLSLALPDLSPTSWTWSNDQTSKLLSAVREMPVEDPGSLLCEQRVLAVKEFIASTTFSGSPEQADSLLAFLYLWSLLVPPGNDHSSLQLVIRSQLPIGAGLGSSASYSAALVTSLLLFYGLIPSSEEVAHKELINHYTLLSETLIHGNPSGIDNAMCVFGGAQLYAKGQPLEAVPGYLHRLSSNSSVFISYAWNRFKALRFLLINTRVPKRTRAQVEQVAQRRRMVSGSCY